MDGAYKIKVKQGATIVLVTLVFQCGKKATASIINVVLSEEGGQALQEIVVRIKNTGRVTKSPLPIDVVSAKDLVSTGQTTFDKALQYRIPSFSTNSGK
jgi:iron complex outermembrane receptor protein